jgi:hypothetical protein
VLDVHAGLARIRVQRAQWKRNENEAGEHNDEWAHDVLLRGIQTERERIQYPLSV